MRTLGVLVACLVPLAAGAGDSFFTHQGRVLDTLGDPVEGSVAVAVTLYSDSSGTTDVWRQTYSAVAVQDGYYSVHLEGLDGESSPRDLDGVVGAASALWLGVTVGGGAELSPLQRLPATSLTGVGGTGVEQIVATAGGACSSPGGMGWNDTVKTMYACDGLEWFPLASSPNGPHRWVRLKLIADDPTETQDFVGGFTVFTDVNGGGTNLGAQAGTGAYDVFGPINNSNGSDFDPGITANFALLTGNSDANDGRARCRQFQASGNCWLRLDLGSPQLIRSWGMMGRPNASTGHWQSVEVQVSDDGSNWTTIDTRTGLGWAQQEVRIFNFP